MTHYRLDEFMITDQVEPYPASLWEWGITHRQGHLRTKDRQLLRLALLPRAEAQVTRSAIMFGGVPFTCQRAIDEQWYVRASLGTWKVPIVYDLRDTDTIYLLLNGERVVETATVHDARFAHQDWYDVTDYLTCAQQAHQMARGDEEQALSDLRHTVKEIVAEAQTSTAQMVKGMSHAERVNNIRANRQEERERLHAAEAWTPKSVIAPSPPMEDDTFAHLSHAEWIRRTQAADGGTND
jgi:putative transposase